MTSLISRQLRSATVPRIACSCSWYFSRTIHLSADVLKDYYKILGVNKSSSQKDIKSAYFKLAKKYHPDANPGNAQAAEKFRDASEAYETLSNKQKKESYDAFGSTPNSSQGYGNPFANQQQWGYQSSQMNPKEAEEMFKKIMQELGAQGNAGFSQKSGGGVFGSIFSSMAQGFGRKMAEEMMKGTNSNSKAKFQKFEIKQTKNGFEIKKK